MITTRVKEQDDQVQGQDTTYHVVANSRLYEHEVSAYAEDNFDLGAYYTGIKCWEFSLEGYYKQMYNVLEYQDGVTFFGSSVHWEEKVEMGQGRSMGVELMIQKTTGNTTGWLAYTLAKSDRQFKNGTINNGERFPYKYDRRHNISLCLNHKFSERMDIGASWIFNTGGTASIAEQQTAILYPNGEITNANYIEHRNNYRLPASHRLNIGINFNKKNQTRYPHVEHLSLQRLQCHESHTRLSGPPIHWILHSRNKHRSNRRENDLEEVDTAAVHPLRNLYL